MLTDFGIRTILSSAPDSDIVTKVWHNGCAQESGEGRWSVIRNRWREKSLSCPGDAGPIRILGRPPAPDHRSSDRWPLTPGCRSASPIMNLPCDGSVRSANERVSERKDAAA